MTKVACSVGNCSYNENNFCYAKEILMSEHGTNDSEVTCCGSFLNKESYANLAQYTMNKQPTQNVKCKVGSCRHYNNEVCTLSEIYVAGKIPTCIYIETYCSSFESR